MVRAMPLLSTLAALVILVSSEEPARPLRPRALAASAPQDQPLADYDQPWRVMETESRVGYETHRVSDWAEDSDDEPVRRRPVKKRRRRPAHTDHTDLGERTYDADITEPPPEPPRRRRKHPAWGEGERPRRRRQHKRKRPILDPWPALSEFEYRSSENQPEHARTEQTDPAEPYTAPLPDEHFQRPRDPMLPVLDEAYFPPKVFSISEDQVHLKEDKSLSEFSLEVGAAPPGPSGPRSGPRQRAPAPLREDDALSPTMDFLHKAQKDKPIDPLSLKEILKRSNGTSLSEILQQHNLSLSDLLSGRENAISALKSEESVEALQPTDKIVEPESLPMNLEPLEANAANLVTNKLIKETVTEDIVDTTETAKDVTTTEAIPTDNAQKHSGPENETPSKIILPVQESIEVQENAPKILPKRRFPGSIRRKLRMRPGANGTFKAQLNRDLIAMTTKRYLRNNRNTTKSKEWRQIVPMMSYVSEGEYEDVTTVKEEVVTTTSAPEDTTTQETEQPTTFEIEIITDEITSSGEGETINTEAPEEPSTTELTTQETTTVMITTTTEKPKPRGTRPNRLNMRRLPYNRLKRKRLKQRTSTMEPSAEPDLFGGPNFVSSSELIAKTQKPNDKNEDLDAMYTTLEDFMTTQAERRVPEEPRPRATTPRPTTTTEDTAKIEIEEIFNDTKVNARLSKILKERNMTLGELVALRGRGSSHLHLADIFHNASREPNPPEPFLSKSSIEPISKETYPLRALLEANLHDAKVTTDSSEIPTPNIPVVMDFKNNVNENGETMGIISLFSKIADRNQENAAVKKDSDGAPYITTVITVNATDYDRSREGRNLHSDEARMTDLVGWSELLSLMHRSHNTTEKAQSLTLESSAPVKAVPPANDGVIVLEDYVNDPPLPSVPSTTPAPTLIPARSVTVAAASVLGLATVLFLLTYAAFKWRQQRTVLNKKQTLDDRIPSPVFEKRKGKSNCSTRSISPMLASNIYSLSTLDSARSQEEPDYMWDSLRKPFQ